MIGLVIKLDGDGAFPDLADKINDPRVVIHLGNDAPPIQVAALEGGMKSGRTSVMLRIDLPNNKIVLAETSLRLFQLAAKALTARYGDQTE